MSQYAEYLKANGATDEDVKLYDTPIMRKLYDAKIASDEQAAAERTQREEYAASVGQWHDTQITPVFEDLRGQVTTAQAREAAIAAALRTSTDAGLKKVAKDMGFKVDDTAPTTPTTPVTSPVDASKFVSKDEFSQVADRVGGTLAQLMDMAAEHATLFPGQSLNLQSLRNEAVAARKGVYEFWEGKFKVPDARNSAAAARRKAEDDKIRLEERKAVETEFASKYGNPDLRPFAPSNNPFTLRKEGSRSHMPWVENGVAKPFAPDRSNERVAKVTESLIAKGLAN